MDQSEYDRKYRRQGIVTSPEADDTEAIGTQSIVVDGQSIAPLNLTIINSTPQDLNARMHEQLREHVEVVGRVGDVDAIRRVGGAYDHNEGWRRFMRRCGRLRQ